MLDVHMTSWRRADKYGDKIGEPNINAIQSYRYFNVVVCPYCHTQQRVNPVLQPQCIGGLDPLALPLRPARLGACVAQTFLVAPKQFLNELRASHFPSFGCESEG